MRQADAVHAQANGGMMGGRLSLSCSHSREPPALKTKELSKRGGGVHTCEGYGEGDRDQGPAELEGL